jgi:hypothetical protein
MRLIDVPLLAVGLALLSACRDAPIPSRAPPPPPSPLWANVTLWARGLDSLAGTVRPVEFDAATRSTEGGRGRSYQLPDSAQKIDVEFFGETGKRVEQFFARGSSLRLAVSVDQHYDRPMSGNVVREVVDSTWFEADSALRWVDSASVVHTVPDSSLRSHGADVRSEFDWALKASGSQGKRSQRNRKS